MVEVLPAVEGVAAGTSGRSGDGRRRLEAARSGTTAALLTAAGLVVAWYLGAWLIGRGVPTPAAVLSRVTDDGLATYADAVRVTFREAAIGFLWGNAIGIVLGIAASRGPWLSRPAMLVATLTYTIPVIAIGVLLTTLYPGSTARIVLAATFVVFTTTVGTALGLKAVDPRSLEVARSAGLGTIRQWWSIRIPAALPQVFDALRIAAPAAVLGAIIGQYLGGKDGLGVAMVNAQRSGQVERTWALALSGALLAAVAWFVVGLAGRRFRRWSPGLAITIPVADARPTRVPLGPLRPVIRVAASIALAVALWYFALWALQVNPFLTATPVDVWGWLVTGPGAATHRSELLSALGTTLLDGGLGFLSGAAGAVALACAVTLRPRVERVVMPFALVLQSVPVVAFLPVLVLVLGRGLVATAAVAGLVAFFPVFVTVTAALRRVPPASLDLMACTGHGPGAALVKVRLPHSMPALFAATRIALPASLVGALLVEYLVTGQGLGHLMLMASTRFQYRQLWAAVAVVTGLSIVLVSAAGWAERVTARRYGLGDTV
jgi:sulfonate transport system permease protein